MAKTTAAALEPEVKTEKAETTAAPSKFKIERLRRDCLRLFGVTFSTFDGATFGLTDMYTVEEMHGIIDNWQNKQVIPANKKEGN